MEKKKRSPLMVIGFAVLIGFLVIALLNGTIRPASVVAAKVGLAPGTLLTADLLEVRSVPAGGAPSDAFKAIADVEGQMLTVGRAPGDFITKAVVGVSAASGILSQLEPGHVALAGWETLLPDDWRARPSKSRFPVNRKTAGGFGDLPTG